MYLKKKKSILQLSKFWEGYIITTTIFFLLVNTGYYWEGKLGFFAFPVFILLTVVCIILSLFRQVYFLIKEKFSDKQRFYTVGLLAIVVSLTLYKPAGLINFDRLEGKDILIAKREGAANCMTSLKLKDNFIFRERNVCFGLTEIKGNYHYQNDTIYFDNVSLGRDKDVFYKFAIIRTVKLSNHKFAEELVRFKAPTDTIGHKLWITKNDLNKLNGY